MKTMHLWTARAAIGISAAAGLALDRMAHNPGRELPAEPQTVRAASTGEAHGARENRVSLIVQADSSSAAAEAVHRIGGTIRHEPGIINAVAARLTPALRQALDRSTRLTLFADAQTNVAGFAGDFWSGTQVGADRLHASGITGRGVTIAMIDTGIWRHTLTTKDSQTKGVYLAGYNAIENSAGLAAPVDENGHGTHVLTIATSSVTNSSGKFAGIAPDSARVVVKAFGKDGTAT
jgi:serine protease AprX